MFGTALLISSVAPLFSACSERRYSLGSPAAGDNAGGAGKAQGSEFGGGGSLSMAGDSSSVGANSGATSTSGNVSVVSTLVRTYYDSADAINASAIAR